MLINRIFLIYIMMAAFVFSACQAAAPVDGKTIFIKTRDHLQLGVLISDLDEEKTKETGAKEGAYIVKVLEDTEAEKIGLKKGDVIASFDGKSVKDADELHDIISDIEDEKEVQISVVREKKDKTFKAKLRRVKKDNSYVYRFDDEDPLFDIDELPSCDNHFDFFITGDNSKGGFLGINAKNISESMLDYFEVKNGVLIEDVIDEAPAEKAGLKAGDIITKINDRKITDYDDLIRTLNYYNAGEKVTVNFSRKGSAKSVEVTLAEKKKVHPNFRSAFDLNGKRGNITFTTFQYWI